VTLADKDGKNRIEATTFTNGSAGVILADKDGKGRIEATTFTNGSAGVTLADKDGKSRIGASTFADGAAGVGLPRAAANLWECNYCHQQYQGSFSPSFVKCPAKDMKQFHWWIRKP
jgi:hypothetical protein